MDVKKLIYAVRALGLRGVAHTVQYGFQRDRANRRYLPRPDRSTKVVPGDIQKVIPVESGVKVIFDHASVEIICLTPEMIKISWEPGKKPIPYTIEKFDCKPQHPAYEVKEDSYVLSTEKITITVSKNGKIQFQDKSQNIILADDQPVLIGDCWKLTSKLKPEEHIYGLGERISALNLRPGRYSSWNNDLGGLYIPGTDPVYIGTPIYLSLSSWGSYLVYFENSHKSQYSLEDELEVFFYGGMLRYYVIIGSINLIYEQLSELVGHPFLPPRWALGYHQSRWGYRSEADIRRVVQGFLDHNLPLSVIHLDIDYMDGFRVFTIDPDRYPHVERLLKELNDKNIKVVVTLNPAIKQDGNYKLYTDGIKKDLFCKLPDGKVLGGVSWSGWSVFPDFTNPEARKWWSEQYETLLKIGISGFWHDMNEPVSMSAWGDMSFPYRTMHDMEGQGGNHLEAHNLYGLLMNKAGFEAVRKYAPKIRPWIFSRSGWAGMQRYAWNWTGDCVSTWEALRYTIPTILGLGLSGHGFTGVDIGGFSGNPDAELYLRWFQMATFLPLFRTHSAIGTNPREPWVFGETTTSIIRQYLQLRYKLIPYLYTLAWEASKTGFPPVRPIFWEAANDPVLWDVDDEFMLGDRMLIAPVTSKGAQIRKITLPPGRWYSFWDDRFYEGPAQFEVQLALEMIPIFIKSGTILPMEEDNQLTLHVYPDLDGATSNPIFSDKGDGYESWRVDTLQVTHQPDSMSINWEKEGDYVFPYSTIKIAVHHKKPIQAIVDDVNISIADNSVTSPVFTTLRFKFE